MSDNIVETDPNLDPQTARTLLANERTYLACVRTALAFVAVGVGVSKLLPPLELVGGRRVLGAAVVALAAVIGVVGYVRWRANDRSIRAGRGVARGRAPQVMAAIVALSVVLGFIAALVTTR